MKQADDANRLPSFKSDRYTIFSDYSGQHKTSRYQTYSFLIVNRNIADTYHYQARLYRLDNINDGRVVSHKNLRDNKRMIAARNILRLAKLYLSGTLVTIAVDNKLIRLTNGTKIEFAEGMDQGMVKAWNSLPAKTAEQTSRTVHFVSLLISGLLPEDSEVTWITDNDEILNSKKRKTALYKVFKSISSMYLHHNMGNLWLGDANLDNDSKIIEDILCLPDLAAGSFCKCLNEGLLLIATNPRILMPKKSINEKSLSILHSFSSPTWSEMTSFFFVLNSATDGIESYEYLVPNLRGSTPPLRNS